MKIQKVKIKNFRNIENIEKEIGGANILLVGENTKGKSNFIKAVEIALGMTSQVGVNPIMQGKEESNIQVFLGDDGKEYKFEVTFEEGKDKPKITVTAPDGIRTDKKTAIGSIVGEIEFDIDEFVDMSDSVKGRKEQVEIVKSFLPADIKESLAKHENHVANLYEDRTETNKKVKMVEGFIAESKFSKEEIEKHKTTIDISALSEQLNKAVETETNISKAKSKREELDKSMARNITRVEELRKEIEKLTLENDGSSAQIVKIDEWQKATPVPNKEGIMQQITDANAHNAMVEKIASVAKQQEQLEVLRSESEDYTVQIEATRQAISDAIKELDMPIEGLSFDNEQLMYFGKPVNKSTLSTSEIMMLGAKLKIAKNPNAHVLFIQRGESLGTTKLRELQKMAEEYNFQIIMEQMERGKEELQIQFMPTV